MRARPVQVPQVLEGGRERAAQVDRVRVWREMRLEQGARLEGSTEVPQERREIRRRPDVPWRELESPAQLGLRLVVAVQPTETQRQVVARARAIRFERRGAPKMRERFVGPPHVLPGDAAIGVGGREVRRALQDPTQELQRLFGPP